jgi:ribonucleoside-diphosphate reductase alpha chain
MAELNLSETARAVLMARYLATPTETPEELFLRVAKTVAAAEYLLSDDDEETTALRVAEKTKTYYDLMTSLDFLPNSPTLMNAGRPLGQLSACFVLPVGDSMPEIFETLKQAALIHQSGGGTGFSFSRLRAAGSAVASTNGKASGPLSFIRVFDAATEAIKQGGTRRGANLGLLRVDHPDILDFIQVKAVDGQLPNFNLSVGLTDQFMRDVEDDNDYYTIDPHTGKAVGTLPARLVFDTLVRQAHATGEPGVVFLDAVNRANPTPGELIESTNPCGEQPLLPYEACNLGSVNLTHMVAEEGGVDWIRLEDTVQAAVEFLDDVVTVNKYPLPKIAEKTLANRKVGLGVMGLADLLIQLGIPYDSDNGVAMVEDIMKFIQRVAYDRSHQLGLKRGSFPNWSNPNLHWVKAMRNATVTTVAPTGTLSMLADCSGGIEPLFALSYQKHVLEMDIKYVHPGFAAWLKKAQLTPSAHDSVLCHVLSYGSCQGCDLVPPEVKLLFRVANEISADRHVEMQAVVQRHVDNAVSKTINLPATATEADVARAIQLAHRLGCKGLTVYRDGSRTGQVLTAGTEVKVDGEKEGERRATIFNAAVSGIAVRERPEVTAGRTYKTKTGCGSLYVTVNHDDHGPCEVFIAMGKSGGCPASNAEAVARLISLALRSGIDLASITNQLAGIRCPTPTWHAGVQQLSCVDALAQVLRGQLPEAVTAADLRLAVASLACPDCGCTKVVQNQGCATCPDCGWSKCS